MTSPRATLPLLSDCDNRCVFCAPDGLDDVAPRSLDDVREALAALRPRHDAVTFTGGEPTLHPALPEAVAAARALGFRRVGLQTNGRRLREPGVAAALRRAGLTDVHVSLHGAVAALHDHHTGVEGSFTEATAGLGAAVHAGITAIVTTVLTRSNARSLGALAPWLSTHGVAAWTIAVPRTVGRLRAHFDPVFPRLALSLPYALHALTAARGRDVAVFLHGAPLCLLGPFAARSLPAAPRSFHAVRCEGCPARAACPGVDARYLQRFDGDELAASRAPATSTQPFTPRDEALAAAFVGEGPGAADAGALESPPPPARVALPVVR